MKILAVCLVLLLSGCADLTAFMSGVSDVVGDAKSEIQEAVRVIVTEHLGILSLDLRTWLLTEIQKAIASLVLK